MTDSCSGLDLLLMVYADGETSADERGVVEAHLQTCPRCRQRLAEWQALNRHAETLVTAAGAREAASAQTQDPNVADGRTPGLRTTPSAVTSTPVTRPAVVPATANAQQRTDGAAHRTLAIGVLMSLLAVLLLPIAVAKQGGRQEAKAAANLSQGPARVVVNAMTVAAATAGSHLAAQSTVRVTVTSATAIRSSPAPLQPAASKDIPLAGQIAAGLEGDIHLHGAAGDRQLTHTGTATAPRWSPSGRWLLYETIAPGAAPRLWLLQPDTSAAVWPLPAPADSGLARWSPRHDEIAVAARGGSLWLVQAGSDGPRQLLPAGGAVTNLAWSPDGTELAVERRGIGNLAQSIWLVSRGGAISQVPVPTAATPPTVPQDRGSTIADRAGPAPGIAVLGSWAPANTGFTYWSSANIRQGASTPAPLALWSLHQGAQSLLPAVLMYRDFVSWAPDGHALAAVASVLTPDGSERLGQITVVPMAPPGVARALRDGGRADGDPAWSPDGDLIAYASSAVPPPADNADTPRRIWLEAPDGSGRRPLSPGPEDSFPQWSRDGNSVLYVHQTAGSAQLWLVARDGTDPHLVLSGIAGLKQLPGQDFGNSGLASYRGVFDWSAAASGN